MSHEEKRFYVLYQPEPRAEHDLENRTAREVNSETQRLAPELVFDIDEATQQAEQDALFGMRDGKVNPAVYDQFYAKSEYRGGPRTIREAMVEVWIGAGEAISLSPDESGVFVRKEIVDRLCAPIDPDQLHQLMHEVIDRSFGKGSDRKSMNQRFRASAEAASAAAQISMTADEMTMALATDLRNIFFTRDADRLPSALLVVDLALQGDRWSRFSNDKPITTYQLGQLLRTVGVESKVFHIRKKDRWAIPGLTIGDNVRCFKRSKLEGLFKRCGDTKPEQVLIYQPIHF